MFEGFVFSAQIAAFFALHIHDAEDFDVLDVPAELWQHLYLVDVGRDGSLIIRLCGNFLSDVFKRPLKGVDLRSIVHGEHSGDVLALYEEAGRTGQAFAVQQTVVLPAQGCIMRVECAMRPLWDRGRPARILGCFFVDRRIDRDGLDSGQFRTKIRIELPEPHSV